MTTVRATFFATRHSIRTRAYCRRLTVTSEMTSVMTPSTLRTGPRFAFDIMRALNLVLVLQPSAHDVMITTSCMTCAKLLRY